MSMTPCNFATSLVGTPQRETSRSVRGSTRSLSTGRFLIASASERKKSSDWTAREPKVIVGFLRIFSMRALPEFDARLIELCRHDDKDVRERAFRALTQNRHPLIREFALAGLARGERNRFTVALFINNYCQG